MKTIALISTLLFALSSLAEQSILYDPSTSVLVCLYSKKGGKHSFKSVKFEWEDWEKENKIYLVQEMNHIIRAIHLGEKLDYGQENVTVSIVTYHSNKGHWDTEIPISIANEEKKIKAHILYHKENKTKYWERNPRGLNTISYIKKTITSKGLSNPSINIFTGLPDPFIDKVLLVPKKVTKLEELSHCAH